MVRLTINAALFTLVSASALVAAETATTPTTRLLRSWRFSPARQADHVVPAMVEVPIRFTFSTLGGN
jgi:hypothetical protein